MSKAEYDTELFDSFLTGKMTDPERNQFETDLKQNKEMAQEFELYKSMVATVERQGRHALKKELQLIHGEKDRGAKVKTLPSRKRSLPWLAAASLLLLVMATWFIMRPNSPTQLAASYFEPYEMAGNLRNSEDASSLAAIQERYNKQDYVNAIPLLQEELQQNPNNNNLRLALAMSWHKTEQTSKALAEVNSIHQSKDDLFLDHANWYSALFELHLGNLEKAIPFLEKLVADKNADHHAQAKEILSNLK